MQYAQGINAIEGYSVNSRDDATHTTLKRKLAAMSAVRDALGQ